MTNGHSVLSHSNSRIKFIQSIASLDDLPCSEESELVTEALDVGNDSHVLTVGDMHGNWYKLIWILSNRGFLRFHLNSNVPEERDKERDVLFRELRALYEKSSMPSRLTRDDLIRFNTLLNQATWCSKNALRLLGDELADRGSNDYFTLKIIEKMCREGIYLEIIASNHGHTFLKKYNEFILGKKNTAGERLDESFYSSLNALFSMLESGLVSFEEITGIVEQYYRSCLKILSCEVEPGGKGVRLYMHAPVGFETIPGLAAEFGVPYSNPSDAYELYHTLERINAAYLKQLDQNAQSIISESDDELRSRSLSTPKHQHRIMTNTKYKGINLPETFHGVSVSLYHGHTPTPKKDSPGMNTNTVSLDNSFGKGRRNSGKADHYEVISFVDPDTLDKQKKSLAEKFNAYEIGRPEKNESIIEKLRFECSLYKKHLANEKDTENKVSAKLVIVDGLLAILKKKELASVRIREFNHAFNKDRAILEAHRDGAAMRFLKNVIYLISIFLFGLGFFFSQKTKRTLKFSQSHGQALARNLDVSLAAAPQ